MKISTNSVLEWVLAGVAYAIAWPIILFVKLLEKQGRDTMEPGYLLALGIIEIGWLAIITILITGG